MFTLGKDTKITRVSGAVAAGTTAINSSCVDMTGFDSVMFIAELGTVTAGAVIQLSALSNTTNSNSGGATEKAGTQVTDSGGAQSNQDYVVDVHRPAKQFVYANLTRTTANVVVNGVYAIQYNAAKGPLPVSQPATTAPVDFGGPNA